MFIRMEKSRMTSELRLMKFLKDLRNPLGGTGYHQPPFIQESPIF